MTKEEIKKVIDDVEENTEESKVEEIKEPEEPKPKNLELKDLPGIGATSIEKLEKGGILTPLSFASRSPSQISDETGLSQAIARKAILFAKEALRLSFVPANEFVDRMPDKFFISTGSKEFDNLLRGGVSSAAITEAFSEGKVGKCLSKDTKILADNELVEIQSLWNNKNSKPHEEGEICPINIGVYSINNKTNEVVNATSNILWRQYSEKLLKITTRAGRIMKLTPTHQLPTFTNKLDWTKSKDIKVGDYLRIPSFNQSYNKNGLISPKDPSEDDAYFMGLWTAEGSSNPVAIHTGDDNICKWVKEYLLKKYGYSPTIGYRNNCHRILIRNKTYDDVLREMVGKKSGEKDIPLRIMLADINIKKRFLEGYFDGDGYAKKMEVVTKSRKLASDLSYLVNSLKIKTLIKDKYVEGYGYYKRITLSGEYLNNINFRKVKHKIRVGNYSIPKPVVWKMKKHYDKLDKYIKLSRKEYNIENLIRTIFMKNGENCGYEEFKRYLNWIKTIDNKMYNELIGVENYEWDKIIKIEEIDYNDWIYDLYVPEYHNFIGGEYPTLFHNSQLGFTLAANTLMMGHQAFWLDSEGAYRNDRIKEIINNKRKELETLWEEGYEEEEEEEVIDELDESDNESDKPTKPIKPKKIKINEIYESFEKFIYEKYKFKILDVEECFKNLFVTKALNHELQILLVEDVLRSVEKGADIKLLVIDSFMQNFRTAFTGRGELSVRQDFIKRHAKDLSYLAIEKNIVVYTTGQVMSNPVQIFGDPITPIGGNCWSHNITTRIYLRRARAGTRMAKVVGSRDHEDGESPFQITEIGVTDI